MKDPDSSEGLKQIRELFEEAIKLPKSDRSAFLDKACGEDKALRKKMKNLLREAESVD